MTPRTALLGTGLFGFGGLAVLAALYFQLTLVMGPCTGAACGAEATGAQHFGDVVRTLAMIGALLVATGLALLAPALKPAPRARSERRPASSSVATARAAATVTLAVRESES